MTAPTTASQTAFPHFEEALDALRNATDLTRKDKVQRLLSQIDRLSRSEEGIRHLYEQSLEVENAGFFRGTPWNDPENLVPYLVRGTLMAGHPNSTTEVISLLRALAHANGKGDGQIIKPEEAQAFLEEVVVQNLEFAFQELAEEARLKMGKGEVDKVFRLFTFLLENGRYDKLKPRMAEELQMVCAQRPIMTRKIRRLVRLIKDHFSLDEDVEADRTLLYYIRAIHAPSKLAWETPYPEHYQQQLPSLNRDQLRQEAEQLGRYLAETSLTNEYLAAMLLHLTEHESEIVPSLLGMPRGVSDEWNTHRDFISMLIRETFSLNNYKGVYGLSRMLERSLFSRSAVRAGLQNLLRVRLDSEVEKRILKTIVHPSSSISAKQYLMGATISMLGQPLGVGQGNNATCQSARGLSMWAQHAPAKLINIIITVATQNNLAFRFENQDMESSLLAKGLVEQMDYNLDAVSAILVPHLDKLYNEMMRRALGRGEDPHKWVNPALYGSWIHVGFASCYNPITNAIQDYRGFVRLQYAALHPAYNGGYQMVYPNPVGIFVTSKQGKMMGFHAISLLRVDQDPEDGHWRAYFLNPNNEGRQDWSQGITPTVYGHGEKSGESSLPFEHLASRIYAFHFNTLEAEEHLGEIPQDKVEEVYKLAKESWGETYIWIDTPKEWLKGGNLPGFAPLI